MNKLSLKVSTVTVAVVLMLIAPAAFSSPKNTKKKAGPASPGSASRGEAVFKTNCLVCHFPDKPEKKFGPGLKDLFKNKELPASHKPVTEENVREQIQKGAPSAKPMPMPAFADKLSAAEINDVIAYLKTL